MNNAKEKYPSLFSSNKVDTNLFQKELKDYIDTFKDNPFNNTFEDIYFQECNSSFYYGAFDFIEEKDSIYFENCHFFFNDITHKGNSIFKDSKVTFKNCTFISSLNILPDINYPNIQLTYDNCTFSDTLNIRNIDIYITFNDCSFNDIELKDCNIKNNIFTNKKGIKYNINKFTIDNCTFEKRFTLNNYNIEIFTCINCVFQNKFEFKNNNITKFDIHNSNFEEISDMFASKFIQFKISKSIFNDFSGFENCIFGTSDKLIEEVAKFEYVTFKDILTLRQTKFLSGLDIENINLQNDANFLKTKVELKNTPRETFRLIKHSFDKVGNIIEANKFYSLEMKKREEELKDKEHKDKNFLEWLIFKVHGISSDHSQSWVLSLFWIINITFLYSHYKIFLSQEHSEYFVIPFILNILLFITMLLNSLNIKVHIVHQLLISIPIYLVYSFITKDYFLSCFSNNINPFSIMTGTQSLSLATLVYKVTTAYLMYQFIISIRQNTRRS